MPKCKHCGDRFKPKFSSLEKYCHNEDCRIAYSLEVVAKQKAVKQKKEKEQWKREKAELKENLTDWKKKLQTEINIIVRLIDKDQPCLARKVTSKMDAGHVYSRGSNSTIRFNLHNIHRQSAHSNHYQNDDGLLREGVINEYGADYMEFISELRRTPKLGYKDFEYKCLAQEAQKIASRLKKLDLTYSLQNRIILRNKINKELGIYSEEFCLYSNISNIDNIE